MPTPATDSAFTGSIPQLYERYMVPMLFAHYAADMAQRALQCQSTRVLEIAAGTGCVTRALASALPASAAIVATDLNQSMLDHAAAVGTSRPVQWRQADAMQLPFPDAEFDLVVCQFGAMFFPDRAKAFAEVLRVLRPGGNFLLNVWDGLEHNLFAHTVFQALAQMFPDDPPRFMERVPHGYHDPATIARDLAAGGFGALPQFATVAATSHAESAQIAALAYCQGTPWRAEIESRAPGRLDEVSAIAAAALQQRFGVGAIEGKIQALVVTVQRPAAVADAGGSQDGG